MQPPPAQVSSQSPELEQLCEHPDPWQVNVQFADSAQLCEHPPPAQVAVQSLPSLHDWAQPPCGHSKSHDPLSHEQLLSEQTPLHDDDAPTMRASERKRAWNACFIGWISGRWVRQEARGSSERGQPSSRPPSAQSLRSPLAPRLRRAPARPVSAATLRRPIDLLPSACARGTPARLPTQPLKLPSSSDPPSPGALLLPAPPMTARPQSRAQNEARVAHEDLVIFINACFACTGQREFYSDGHRQTVAIAFLHDYVRGNYRRLYALTLAAGINHYNQALVILGLLAESRGLDPAARREEGQLVRAALRALPPQRAYRVLVGLRERGVNNRRARAIVREYLAARPDLVFDALKYRGKLRALVRHAHPGLPGELGLFLGRGWKERRYHTPLLERFRAAHYGADALYDLPFTIAEGLAARHGVPRDRFLARIAPRLTARERLRLQESARRSGAAIAIDLHRAPLTQLALYALSLPESERRTRLEELDAALRASAARAARQSGIRLGRVVAVLDRSYSSSGSREKPRRPLAVAVASHYLLAAAADDYHAEWTLPIEHPLLAWPRGQTDLATPLLAALERRPDLVVVLSDGHDNDPPGAAGALLELFRRHLDPRGEVLVVHANPVFEANELGPRGLGPAAPTLGLREAEDLPTLLAFARFAAGAVALAELEAYLEARAAALLARHADPRPIAEPALAPDPRAPAELTDDALADEEDPA